MKILAPFLMAMLPIAAGAQSQPPMPQRLPDAAIPKTTAVLVILTPREGVTVKQVLAVMPSEIDATVKLYLDGKIREWYSRGDGRGVVFLLEAKTEDEARAIMEPLP